MKNLKSKFKFRKILVAHALLALLFLASNQSRATESQSLHIAIGSGVAIKNNIRINNNKKHYGGDVIASTIPLLQISYGPVFVSEQGLIFNPFRDGQFSGHINLTRSGDDYYATGMSARYSSWFFGGGFMYKEFHFNISRDIEGRSKGLKVILSYSKVYLFSENISANISVSLECFNKNYAEYYFGVEGNEVTVDRSEYHPKAYCLPGVGFFPGYKVDEHLRLMSGVGVKVLSKQIHNSPTIKNTPIETALILGALWKF